MALAAHGTLISRGRWVAAALCIALALVLAPVGTSHAATAARPPPGSCGVVATPSTVAGRGSLGTAAHPIIESLFDIGGVPDKIVGVVGQVWGANPNGDVTRISPDTETLAP